MNTLHVISSMDPSLGGVCQAVRTMIRGLEETEDCRNEVACSDSPDAEFLTTVPFPTHALGPSRTSWAHSPLLFPWLVKNLPRFDAVIIHGLWQYHGYAVHKALGTLRKSQLAASSSDLSTSSQLSTSLPRCYVMPHGMLDPYFQQDPSRRLKAIRNTVYWKLIERKVVNEADGLLFTCEDERLLAREPFRHYQPRRESVVGLGVEEPPAYTAAMKTSFAAACPGLGDQPHLLFLSRIHPKKGVDLLIRAYAELAESASSSCSQPSTLHPQLLQPLPPLVIAGPLDSAYAREMQQLAADLLPLSTLNSQPSTLNSQPSTLNSPQPPRIHFPGMLTGDAKWGAFHGCEAFILPSHQENFGIAVVEALACGKPVLISNKVNIWREIVKSGGGVAENDSLDGTAKLLERWIVAASGKRQNPDPARGCFEQHYSVQGAALRLLSAIYDRTL